MVVHEDESEKRSFAATNAARRGNDGRPVVLVAVPGVSVHKLRAVFLTMCDVAGSKSAVAYPSVLTVAAQTDLSRATVTRALAALVAQGVLVGTPTKGRSTTRYRINLPGLPGYAGPTDSPGETVEPIPTASSGDAVGESSTASSDDAVAATGQKFQPRQIDTPTASSDDARSLEPSYSKRKRGNAGAAAPDVAGAPPAPDASVLATYAATLDVVHRCIAPAADRWKASYDPQRLVPVVAAFLASGRSESMLVELLAGMSKPMHSFTGAAAKYVETAAARPLSPTDLAALATARAEVERVDAEQREVERKIAAELAVQGENYARFCAERDAAKAAEAEAKRTAEAERVAALAAADHLESDEVAKRDAAAAQECARLERRRLERAARPVEAVDDDLFA